MKLNLCHQLVLLDLSDSDLHTGGRLIASKEMLSLTAATSALVHMGNYSLTSDSNLLASLHLSRTLLGPCHPEGTLQCVPRPADFTCQCNTASTDGTASNAEISVPRPGNEQMAG